MAKVRKKKKGHTGLQEEGVLLNHLSTALSEDEINRVLARALLSLDASGLDRLVDRLGRETGLTLRHVLDTQHQVASKPRAGSAKIRQEWKRAWNDWERCIAEAGYEEGRYIRQDEHWEPPYLDTYSLSDDLDNIAKRMYKLLHRVFDEDIDPDFGFAAAIEQAADDVGSGLPDWMNGGEGCHFGPEVTRCLLAWEWAVAKRQHTDAFEFLDRIRDLDASLEEASLDQDAIAEFVLGLDDNHQQAILQAIEQNKAGAWRDVIGDAHCGWFPMYKELSRRWDPSLFTATCLANIGQDWKLALPVLKDLLRKKTFPEAKTLIEEAIRALLYLNPGEHWDPRDGLLILHPRVRYRTDERSARTALLKAWQKVAVGLGQNEQALALKLQAVVTAKWEDWDAVLQAFQQVETRAFTPMCNRLFGDWRIQVAVASVGVHIDQAEAPELGWLHGLADVARSEGDSASFHLAVRKCLRKIGHMPQILHQARRSLAVLTLDIDTKSRLKKKAPIFYRLLSETCGSASSLDRSRRRWVKRLGGAELLDEVVAFWTKRAADLVPNPAGAHKSRYDECVSWMAAVRELDRSVYSQIVKQWSVQHKRRRNLWKAFVDKRLPIESER